MLVLGELSCWTTFGLHTSDLRLIVLGITGVTASALMLIRILRVRGFNNPLRPAVQSDLGRRAATVEARQPRPRA
jgi:hypothetical protein